MHILILSPVSNSYFGSLEWIKRDVTNEYSFIINEKCYNDYNSYYLEGTKCSFYTVEKWELNTIVQVAIEINNKSKIEYIFSYTEDDVELAALLRKNFKIKGQGPCSAKVYRNKYIMKQVANDFGFKVPAFATVSNMFELRKFANETGLPLIVKPIDGGGASGCKVLSSDEDITFFAKDFNGEMLVEKFISSSIYHIDGMCLNNDVKYVFCSEYINTCLSHQEGKSPASVQLNQKTEKYLRLKEYTMSLLPVFSSPSSYLFHLEVFYDGTDFWLCEIASRMGGGRVVECIKEEFGFHPIAELLKFETNRENYFDKVDKMLEMKNSYGFFLNAPKKGKIVSFPKKINDSCVFDFHIFAKEGQIYSSTESCIENICAISLKCNSEEEARKKINELNQWYSNNCIYEEINK